MRNGIQNAQVLTVTAPYAVTAGQGVQVGQLFGVAAYDAALGAPVEISVQGGFELTAVSANTATVGALLYWDNAARNVTTVVGTNRLIGCALAAKSAGQTTAQVYVDGAIR